MKIIQQLIITLYLLAFSLQEEHFYTVDEVYEYLDYQGYENDEDYTYVLQNLSIIMENSYAFNDIAKNPPQPDFNDEYHKSVNIKERLNNINTTDINGYEFYRRIALALSDLRDSHIQIAFDDFEFKDFFLVSPFEFFIRADEEEKPKIFISCDVAIASRYESEEINELCQTFEDFPIISINGKNKSSKIIRIF